LVRDGLSSKPVGLAPHAKALAYRKSPLPCRVGALARRS